MAISSDWSVDYTAKIISHIDGVLNYDTGSGSQPAVGDVIRGGTTGTLGKILARTGTAASGTFTLTDVSGRFQDNETLINCDKINFDGVTNLGFSVGDTITGATSTRSGVVRKIDYNMTTTAGAGTAWSEQFGAGSWTDNENIQVGGQTRALANGAGVDNSSTWTSALVNEGTYGTITPATFSKIINYDGGSTDFIRFSSVTSTSGGTGIIQKAYGVTATGSLRLVDVTGTWADNDTITVINQLNYNTLQAGQKFKVGDKIQGATSLATGKIIGIVDDGDNTGRLTLMSQTGTFTNAENINVRTLTDTYVAKVENATFTYTHATQNGAAIATQQAAQGGIHNGNSLNVVRDSNALYTFLQDTFDELAAIDDDYPITAQVALQQYTLVNSWKIPDLSCRFLESGSIQDSSLDNVWTNFQTLGTVQGIGDTVYAATTPLPQIYLEQNGSVISPWWLTGHIDILVKVKTNTNPTTTIDADGALINSGTVTVFCRNYTNTYDHFSTTTIAGVAPIPLATASDLNNQTGTHRIDYDAGTSAQALTVGEEITKTNPSGTDETKRGIVTAITTSDNYVTGQISYIMTGTTQFADNDVITGQTSGYNKTVNEPTAIESLVAGYGTKIVIATVEGTLTHGAVSGTFIEGEQVSQAVSGALGIMMADTGSVMTLGNVTGTFNGTNVITGATSTATSTSSSTLTTATTISRNIGDGAGVQPYKAVIYLDRDQGDGVGDTLARMYEWLKYRTRSLETTGEPPYNLLGGPGTALAGYQGRVYTTLDTTYALVKASPFGTFAGGTFFGARGVFVQNMASADVEAYQLIDANGVLRYPPNTSPVSVTVLDSNNAAIQGAQVFIRKSSDNYSYTSDTGNNAADADFVVNEVVSTDIPQTGWVHVWNAASNSKQNYRYISWTGKTFTLPTEVTGSATSTGSSTSLISTTSNFVTYNVQEGDTIRNTTTGAWAIIDEIVDATHITTSPLSSGVWTSGDAYSVHKLAITYTDVNDLVDIPILNGQTNSSGIITMTYAGAVPTNIDIRIRSNTGATKYIPFNTSGSITSSGFSLTAILTTDSVAT